MLDRTFHALASDPRRKILLRLSHGEATVGELAEPLAISAPAVSKHLRVLEQAELVRRRRLGREHHLSLRPERLRQAQAWLAERLAFWEEAFDALERYLDD